MAKKTTARKRAPRKTTQVTNKQSGSNVPLMRLMAANMSMQNWSGSQSRASLLGQLLNPNIDMNYECRYPQDITKSALKQMFDRNSIAHRVVDVWPSESWINMPEIYEDESSENETAFEQAWKEVSEQLQVLHYLKRVDILSGIGRYGVLVIGLDDSLGLNEPVANINEVTGEVTGTAKRRLTYLKPYDESVVEIKAREKDDSSPRYGLPTMYTISMESPGDGTKQNVQIHWSRLLHVVDNRLCSEVYGEPRMQPVYNNLLDLRKVGSGSAEMFWRAGMSGTAWGLDPTIADPTVTFTDDDKEAMQAELEKFYNGMQRYLFSEGMKPMDIAPKLYSPEAAVKVQVQFICIALGIPYRVFMGTEESKLSSTQDRKAWLERVSGRQRNYLTPMLVMPFIKRLQAYGVLPETKEMPKVDWPDRDSPSEADIAETAVKTTEALAKYVQGNVDQLVGPRTYFKEVHKKTDEEVDAIGQEIDDWQDLENDVADNTGGTDGQQGTDGTVPPQGQQPNNA